MDRKAHWERVYQTKQPTEMSWYQAHPTLSLELLAEANIGPEHTILDVGGGDSTLVDALVMNGFPHVTVLDISGTALARARTRLGELAKTVNWVEADITHIELPVSTYDVWHDRAVFHFLVDPVSRARYLRAVQRTLRPNGIVLIATFAPDGPTRCSGLDVVRYSAADLGELFGDAFTLLRSGGQVHHTPTGGEQRFSYAMLRRL